MAYTIKCDGYILDDIRDDELTVSDPEIELEVNTVGGGSFTIRQNHPYYDKLKKLKSVFEVSDAVGVIFRGRMTEDSVDFHNSKAVDLEGAMAYFNDSTVRPFSFPEDFANNAEYTTAAASGNVVAFFLKWLIDRHNAQVQEFQRFKLGNVTVSDPNNYLSRSSTDYASTWETLKSKLFDSALGGYLCIRYEADGNYIDYLSEFTLTNTQEIVFGENLLDMKSTGSATGTYSAMIPLGAQHEAQDDAAGTRRRLTIESIADGNITTDVVKSGDVIYSKSAVEAFGWVCAPTKDTTWDDVTIPARLLDKAVEALTGDLALLTESIEVTALDLHFTDEQIQTFRIYRNVKVRTDPHGIAGTYQLPKLSLKLHSPQDTKITIGATRRTLVDINSERESKAEALIQSAVNELKDYVANRTEESNQNLGGELDSVRRTITEQSTQVLNDAEAITMKALESYVETSAYETFKKTTESELKETSKQISMNFTTVTDQIKDVNGDLQTVSEKLEKHFVFSEEGLIIKAGENSMSLHIDNDIIRFVKGNQEFGWWDGVNFHTGNIYVDVDEVAQFGNYGFEPFEDSTSDGLDLVRVGG
jgi:hypothetical protein